MRKVYVLTFGREIESIKLTVEECRDPPVEESNERRTATFLDSQYMRLI